MRQFATDFRGARGTGRIGGVPVAVIGRWNINVYVDTVGKNPDGTKIEGFKSWGGSFDGRWNLAATKNSTEVMTSGIKTQLELVDLSGQSYTVEAFVRVGYYDTLGDTAAGMFTMDGLSGLPAFK